MSELTKQALRVDNNQSFPNNNDGLITPSNLRTFNENIIDSLVDEIGYNADSASWNNSIDSLNQFTSSQQPSFTALNAFTQSQLAINSGYNNATQSLQGQITTLVNEVDTLQAFTSSVNEISDDGIVQGFSTRLHFYGNVSASIVQNVNGPIASIEIPFSTTDTGSLLTTASFASQNLTFTKGDGSQFSLFIPDNSGSTLPSGVVSGSSQINYPQISNIPAGIVSGSSQLTSSYDLRYALSGSGGGGTGNGFPFSGSAVITGSLSVSETVKSQVYINPQTIDGFTIPTGNNAMLVGPVAVSGSIVVEGNSNLLVLSQITASALPSGVVSGSSQLTASYDLRYALSGSIPNIPTGSFATTGSNTFIGNQTITGSLFLSSSNAIQIIVPNFSGAPAPGGVSITGSVAVQGNFALDGGNFVVGQINTPKIVGTNGGTLDIVSDVKIFNDGNINNPRSLGVSGSAFVSQSLYTGDLYVGGNKQFNVGAFLSNVSQSGSANVSQSIQLEVTDISQGVSIVSGSRITIANSGTYNIQFSSQVDRSSGTGADQIYIWLKKNGNNVADTAGAVTIEGNTAAAKTIAAWNYVVNATASDYYELCWQSSDANIVITRLAASGNIPSVPSTICTVTQVR